ncbi:8985_t:CDS:2 [Funneliformis mosseae]|uniref:8985_t:CDS:1 n=1 Tax=Funneliformis mosseae TaxID=27381 RepID=A0A9N8YPL7_FUNMO|nr:8985_t:CDS:2 [Funneliformis mosseae]
MTFKKKVVKEIPGFEYIHSDIVLIPGFRGSKLVNDKTKKTGWISLCTPFLPQSKESIDLPLNITKHEQDSINGTIIHQPFKLHKFSYDWRRTNESSTEIFIKFLQDIYNNNGNKKIYIIAHSNGGLISLSALHQHPHLIGGIIFAGTPFGGAPGIFGNLRHGISLLFNKKIQDDAAHFALRTVFSLMPPKLDAFKDQDDSTKYANIDYFDVEEWKNSDWSLAINEDNPRYNELGTRQERIDYLQRTLEAAKRFHKTLEKPSENFEYPPLCTLVSNIHLTNGGYPMGKLDDGRHSILYDKAIAADGDSAVPIERTKLPEGIPFEVVHTNNSHGSLLEDLEAVGKALQTIFNKH